MRFERKFWDREVKLGTTGIGYVVVLSQPEPESCSSFSLQEGEKSQGAGCRSRATTPAGC